MSAPAKEGPAVPAEKEKRLSKFLGRMKTVLKKGDGSKRLSFLSKDKAGPSKPAAATPTKPADTTPAPTKIMRSQIDAERVRKLGEKFKVSIEPLSTGLPDREAYRIEKPIRMRIHRQCHICSTTYGNNKVCAKCQHTKCKLCPRYPPKKPEGKSKEAKKPKEEKPEGWIEPDTYFGIREQLSLTKPSGRAGGQPLVRKKPMQRVRRNCCSCQSLFLGGAKLCSNCQHVRCADCPRDPAKKKKYPDGYPGDAPSSNPSAPIKYSCHKCSKTFPAIPNPATSGEPTPNLECVRCHHELCKECPRAVPVKVEPAPDPAVLEKVREKLARLDVGGAGGGGKGVAV
jgi:hypothetical protein